MRRILSSLLSLVIGAFSFQAAAAEGQIQADEAYTMVKRGELLIIDVRTSGEWRGTGIPEGARMAEYGSPTFLAAVTGAVSSDRTRAIAVICRSGNRSALARRALEANGFTHVLDIREGMLGSSFGPGWLKRGLPITPCPNCP